MNKSSRGGSASRRKFNKKMDQEKNQSSTKLILTKNENTQKIKQNFSLKSYQELPEYMKDNDFILNYYRTEWPITQAFFSLFHWHNETLNVWTHLIGFILFVCLTIGNAIQLHQVADIVTIFTRHFSTSADANISGNPNKFLLIGLKQESSVKLEITSPETSATSWPFFVFLSGSMFCLLSSSICHLFSCHSKHLNLKLLQMDYVGITVMIITSFFPPVYYIFQCSPHWQIVYLSGITIMGVCTIMTLLSPAFTSGKYRSFRALLFVSMGLFGLVPAIHALAVNWNDPHRNVTLAYESVMGLSYLIGTMFYVTRIPERWRPGWFDLAGHSHQIFHVFVMCGALAHYGAARIFLQYRSTMGCNIH
ncbi:hypothetical protein Leryth_027452 [Lithospermum erythrorhizon]|uniref:G-protein coupled receptor n=1 Tax=Lithospermum erythrorhizon TaxID=34254 RepID=A0AAV3PQM4_LITER|nr:hypothetical protein Leryth_027452 [Lithospermum erythrorhizon]